MTHGDALGGGGALSSLRTYRYARLSLVAAVVLLGTGLAWHFATGGPLRSISASYYTPIRSLFTGALVAVGVALVVLAGRSVRRFLLLLAGMTAPVIALVPVPLTSEELRRLLGTACPGGATACLPDRAAKEVAASLPAYLITAAAVLLTSVVLLALDRVLDRWALVRTGIAAALLIALAGWSTFPSFLRLGHYAAAGLFFFLIAITAGIHAAAVREEGASGPGTPRFYSRCYAALAVLIAAVDATLIALLLSGRGTELLGEQWLLLGEALALALFGVFWVLQTVENWDRPDALLLARR
ncbi:hypothetical protein C5C18_03060 [Rathayibacter tritici]|uniref:hypothetical protein n=1 Tax=Rathayibacter tritici TaxID=33888 RepID=UPI000CE78F4C|nr:hypothetical protein [Rathayibacter tritici]PPF30638.1 hypothetical protein C5C06_04435 [Rathayibacter tritici]PPF70796.1 hypothetical protein C5C21_00610 [Rathayibacter tritici]PPG08804.1 hypothetical protein C5C18_03060 [Rathayibacter tritici]PPI14893.1 hypothetical protein C5D07_07520 [Rathayibacter tritici]